MSKPSAALESPVAGRMRETKGPTLAMAGRRFRATRTMPTISSHRRGEGEDEGGRTKSLIYEASCRFRGSRE